jgi:hypothetical protein
LFGLPFRISIESLCGSPYTGVGGGLLGGVLLEEAIHDHDEHIYDEGLNSGYDQGYDNGLDNGFDDGGFDNGGFDNGGSDFF